jgi:hypothetical protein
MWSKRLSVSQVPGHLERERAGEEKGGQEVRDGRVDQLNPLLGFEKRARLDGQVI